MLSSARTRFEDRPLDKPLTLFVRDPSEWHRFASHANPELVERLTEAFWPGPLNLVLPESDVVPHDHCTPEGTVSIGCLSNPVWRDLSARVDGPLAMISANKAGTVADSTLVDVDLAVEHVGDDLELILAGEAQGTTRARRPSSISPPTIPQFGVAGTSHLPIWPMKGYR